MWRYLFAAVVLIMTVGNAAAHSGRTNAQGCHNDRKNGGYHCHNGGTARSSAARAPTYTPSQRPAATVQPQHSMQVNGERTTVAEDFYVCVQEVQNLAQNYSAALLANTHEQYKVQLEMEDGAHTITCLATHQKIVEHSK